MSLSIQDCATQFDLYAASKDQQAADQRAHAETLPKEGIGRSVALMLAEPYAASAFSLRFAATFLRENCQPAGLTWTSERPDKEGFYWHRIAGSVGRPTVREVFWGTESRLLLANAGFPLEISTLSDDNQWAGPLQSP